MAHFVSWVYFLCFFGAVIATVAQYTFFAPRIFNIHAQLLRVAPVVFTSSTSKIVLSLIKTNKIGAISGPSFAIDLVSKVPVGLSVASKSKKTRDIKRNDKAEDEAVSSPAAPAPVAPPVAPKSRIKANLDIAVDDE